MAALLSRATLFALASILAGIICFILWLILYALVVNPGQSIVAYQDYAAEASAMIGIMTGVPILFVAGWQAARKTPQQGLVMGALIGIVYAVIDLGLLFVLAGGKAPWVIVGISYATKIVAGAAGGWLAARKMQTSSENTPI